ncbi:myb-like protein X isoform X1 [Patella vulgata]|uniref:myb-like protein X isoform X1 n=2 Tax=Patella vulgata TaxID=6465 RepID=UPI0021805A56|nr:myb-like protein X isoform X1 [Patella vulgata]
MGGGRDGGGGGRMGGRFSDQGGRMGGGRDRDQAKRKDPFQGAPDLGRPYNPKRIKLDKDMSRMGNMIESSSSAINSLRRGWVDMDTKELNKKVEFLINQQMMLIDKQSQMAESLERREIDMHGEMELLLKERADMMRHLDETMRFGGGGGGRGFEDNFGPPLPGPMGQMGPPGPRWSRDNRDNSWISPEESVMRFTEYLLFFQPKSNNAQTLVRAVVSSRLNIKVEMRYKEIERDGEKVFRGHLLLGYFVLQHAYKKTLDELRSYLFDRSVYTLMTKTLGYIAVNSNRVMEAKKNEDRMIRGDEMCEVNGSDAVKIWSSKPDRERHRTDSTSKDKDDEKSEADSAKDVKKEEPESEDVKEIKQEDAEMKDGEKETETKMDIKQEDNEESKEESKEGDDSKNLDESVDGSKDGDKGSRDRDSRDRRDRRDRDRGDRRDRSRDRDRHGRQRKPRSEYKFFSPRLRERLEMMRDELPVGPHIRSIHDMSYAAKCNNVGITLTVYKRRPDDHLLETYDAELYADEIFLGRGHGRDVREAHKYAFIHSRDDILGAPMNELLSTRKRLIELNLNDPLLLDIQYRGPFHDVGNNMSNLKMAREWPLEKESDIADIIILEDQEDRKKNYYKTLEISATQNGMMLEWVRSGRDDTMPHRCQLYLEKTKIADVKSPNKLKAKNMAAFEALQLLKKTQTIIRYSIDPNKKPLFTFNDLKEQARLRHEADKEKKAAEGGENPAEDETTEVKEEESENMGEEKEEATEEGNDEETGGKTEDASEKGEDDKDENKEDGDGDEKSGKRKETRAERKTRHYKERQKEREKEREREKRHEYLDKYMDEIIGEEIDKYLATDDMEGILLGSDLPQNTKRKVSNIAVEKGMLVMPCGSDDVILLNKETYLAPNMMRRLQEAGNQIGRYQIIQLKVEGSDKPLVLIEEEEDDGEEIEHGDDHKDDSHGQDDATPKKVKKTKEGDEEVEKNGNGEVESMEVDKSQ